MNILLSPSQVNTARDCLRKWGISYIDGVKEPTTPAQQFGKDLHATAEAWLRYGTPPDFSTTAKAMVSRLFVKGIKYLPTPSPDLEVEQGFLFKDGDLSWRGFIDLVTPGDVVRVTDHKTTSSLFWAKTPATLKEDTQAIIYGKHIIDRDGLEMVEIQWVYYLKGKKPEAKETIATFTREEINDRYQGLREIGHELLTLKRTKKTGLEIPVETFPHAGCSSYGGCSYFEFCQKLHTKEETMSDLMKKLADLKARNEAAKKPPAPTPAPAPVVEASINPPQAPAAVAIEKAAPPKAAPPKAAPPKTATPETPEKRRPGRPPGSGKGKGKGKGKAKETTPVADPHAAMKNIMPPAVAPAVAAAVEATTEALGGSYTLYIDCLPATGAGNLDEVLRTAAGNAADASERAHYRLIEFGGGPARLCIALREILTEMASEGTLPHRVAVSGENQLVKDALPELEAFALEVVRAFR